jgi:hypothetical protein
MTTAAVEVLDAARGEETGLVFPAHPEALERAGAGFLTHAFHLFGSLPVHNRVARIVRIEKCPGGSTGQKLFLTVAYEEEDASLHTQLFVKFSRDFTDSRRDWQRHEMEPEARFAVISRWPGFPVNVPRAYFADYHRESGTGLVITERVLFGEGTIEPHRRKCLDHMTLGDPLPYYTTLVAALGRLAGSFKAGRLAAGVEERFPFDPHVGSADPILGGEEQVRLRLGQCADFARRCPQLLPPDVGSPEFLGKMEEDALAVLAHETELRRYLTGNSDLISLCHWNAHIDNAWFWREGDGELGCGLIDWGRVGQMTFGSALWGGLSAAHHEIWRVHLRVLLRAFLDAYEAYGGPTVEVDELELHLALHMATMGVARVLAFPEVILFRFPDAPAACGPLDPRLQQIDPARNSLHIYTVFLEHWRSSDFGACLKRVLARSG